ncbi:MAG TPA: HAMP domain-containing sensor histidine kinase, partial [Ktedonobacteraceae bacterium]
MEENETDHNFQEAVLHTQSQHQQERRQRFPLKLTWWRSPLAGYSLCPFLTLMALLVQFAFQRLGLGLYTATTVFYLTTAVVAWLWGIGPALLAVLLGYILLESFVVPPKGVFTFNGWSDLSLYLPFFLTQLLILVITTQRERARHQTQTQALALAHSNQELERANQRKDLFLSQVSHELKNPLAVIRGEAQFILRRLDRAPQTASSLPSLRPSLKKIETQTTRLDALINDLLALSSLRSGKVLLRFAPCDLGSLCREVVEEQQVLSSHHIALDLPSSVMLQADCQRLNQVIINLVSNAIKYSLENTVVLVHALQEPSHLLLTVHNDGPAIPQEQQALIFEPFYRVREARYSSP